MRQILAGVVVAVAISAAAVFAGAPDETASITLNEADPALGMTVSFSYELPKNLSDDCYPNGFEVDNCARIILRCYQPVPFDWVWEDGVTRTQIDPLVYGTGSQAKDNGFLLGIGHVWGYHGGPAYCVAQLYKRQGHNGAEAYWRIYAETSFEAAGE